QAGRFRTVDAVPDATLAQQVADIEGRFVTAESVEDHPHLHAARLRATQGIDHPPASFIQIEDVGFQVDRAPGIFARPDESRKEFAAIVQKADVIAFPPPDLKCTLNHDDAPGG